MILQGRSISPGFAEGTAAVVHPRVQLSDALQVRPRGEPRAERERLLAAIGRAIVQLERLRRQLDRRLAPSDASIFETHVAILRDPKFVEQIEEEIARSGQSAEAAVASVVQQAYVAFAASKQPLVHDKAADLLDIGQRLLQCLGQAPGEPGDELPPGSIVVAQSLTPSQLVHLAHQGVAAVVTESCGPKSHTAILARGMGIPLVTGIADVTELVPKHAPLLVDAEKGVLLVAPGDDQRQLAEAIRRRLVPGQPAELERPLPPVTTDGTRIGLLLNISDPREAASVAGLGADGVGLFRTEFLYMDRSWWPSEDECAADYLAVARGVQSAELCIRLADFGAEKCPVYADFPESRNPSLGLRGIRLLLAREDVLRPQLKALARAARLRPLVVLLPMLDTLDTLSATVAKMCAILGCATRRELPFQVGAMVECPSAALLIEELLAEVDAVSIGLNDLTQYLLAADRDDELVEAYHDAMQPAVLRLVRRVVEAAEAQAKPLTLCGELAGDASLTGMLLALGVRRLSVSRYSFRRVAATIRALSLAEIAPLGPELLALDTGRAVHEFVARRLSPPDAALRP